MSASQPSQYKIKERERLHELNENRRTGVRNRRENLLNPEQALQRLLLGIQKLTTALRFRFHRATNGQFSSMRLPWFKLALAAIAFFIITRKNIQLSFNIKAPLSGLADDESRSSEDQMGVAQAISYKGSRPVHDQMNETKAEAYIRRFARVARAEHDKYGIPASIKMAQALLESQAGNLPEQQGDNNHFGQPLEGKPYDSAWENWRAHSIHIARNHPALFQEGDDLQGWAQGLAETGYTNDSQYADKLMHIIERFQLRQLD